MNQNNNDINREYHVTHTRMMDIGPNILNCLNGMMETVEFIVFIYLMASCSAGHLLKF